MWLEPTDLFWNKFRGALFEKLGNEYAEDLKNNQQHYREIFSAWIRDIFDKNVALGQTIDMNVREAVRPLYDRLKVGLSEDWSFQKSN